MLTADEVRIMFEGLDRSFTRWESSKKVETTDRLKCRGRINAARKLAESGELPADAVAQFNSDERYRKSERGQKAKPTDVRAIFADDDEDTPSA